MRYFFVPFILFLTGLVLLTISATEPIRAQSLIEDGKDVALSATCLPASSMQAPRELRLEINFFDMDMQGHLTSDGGWTVSARPSMNIGRGFAQAQVTFEGPKLIRRDYCATPAEKTKGHDLKGRLLKASDHSSLQFRSPQGTAAALTVQEGRSRILSAKPLKEGDNEVGFGDGTPNHYHLTFVRDISISAPPSDEIEAEFLID